MLLLASTAFLIGVILYVIVQFVEPFSFIFGISVGGTFGFLLCAILTQGRLAEMEARPRPDSSQPEG